MAGECGSTGQDRHSPPSMGFSRQGYWSRAIVLRQLGQSHKRLTDSLTTSIKLPRHIILLTISNHSASHLPRKSRRPSLKHLNSLPASRPTSFSLCSCFYLLPVSLEPESSTRALTLSTRTLPLPVTILSLGSSDSSSLLCKISL